MHKVTEFVKISRRVSELLEDKPGDGPFLSPGPNRVNVNSQKNAARKTTNVSVTWKKH